nr:EAL domain-containing protein [Lysobacter sp. CAU 1642]
MQTLLSLEPDLDAEAFRRRVEALRVPQNFPGLQAVGYAPRERDPDTGALHYRYTLVTPLKGNERLIGLDIATQPANLASLELARDTDEPVMSEPFTLVQHDRPGEQSDGVVIRLPLYAGGLPSPTELQSRRAQELGSIVVSFRVSSLVGASLEAAIDQDRGYELQIRDADQPEGAAPIYSSVLDGVGAAGDPDRPAATTEVGFGGQVWQVRLLPNAQWYADSRREAYVVGGGGVVAALLLAGWITALLRTRERAQRLAEQLASRVRDSEQRFRRLSDLLPTATLVVRRDDGGIEYINHAGRQLLALEAEDPPGSIDRFGLKRQTLADSARIDEDERTVELQALDGRSFQAVWRCAPLGGAGDGADHWLLLLDDATERLQLTAQLRYQASHDALTGLLNRREFDARLRRACAGTLAGLERAVLVYLDIDQFKLINDTCGHAAGDQLLANVGEQLRSEAGERSQVARLGGDEFGLLLAETRPEAFRARAQDLLDSIAATPFLWQGRGFALTASIGAVAFDAADRPDPAELLAIADTACYLAKEAGRNRVMVHNEDEQVSHRRRNEMDWVQRIREALAEDRFCLYFQELRPLGRQVGAPPHFELLVRMRDRSGAMVPPGAFIPAAERFGVMPEVDRWVVRTALARFESLHPQGGEIGLCSINLSGATMGDESFPGFLLAELARAELAPDKLCFEITETSAVSNFNQASALIGALRQLGCKVALDDFGAGMSSFAYLKNLPVDYLKIDGSFIRDLVNDELSQSIVAAITKVGHQVGTGVIAEFVGSEEAIDLLREMGVDYAQGFGVHVPEIIPAHASLSSDLP